MQDDPRAEMLFRALTGAEASPDETDDEELRALIALGARLDAMRPAFTALEKAEQAFNPVFAQELHRALIAAHPAATEEQAAVNNNILAARRTMKLLSRRFLALLALIAALAVIAVTIIVQDGRQTALVGTAALSPTRAAPRSSARSFAALAPRNTPVAGRAAVTPTVPGPAPLSLGSAPSPKAGKSPTPAPAHGSTAASGAAPMHLDTIVPRASDVPNAFRYKLPPTLPSEPSTVPIYRVVRKPTTKAQAQAIAATFTGMRPITGTSILSFAGDGALLRINPTSGVVDYLRTSVGQGSATTTAPPAKVRAESIARQWLVTHHLLAKTTGPLTVNVTNQGTIDTIRFTPTLRLPLLPGAQTPAAVVEVDRTGNVVDAHVAWANLQPAGTATIVSPAAAAGIGAAKAGQAKSTPVPGPVVTLTKVTLVYESVEQNDALVLRPVYQLTGTLDGKAVTAIVPASRKRT
jgi:hypothetical protein